MFTVYVYLEAQTSYSRISATCYTSAYFTMEKGQNKVKTQNMETNQPIGSKIDENIVPDTSRCTLCDTDKRRRGKLHKIKRFSRKMWNHINCKLKSPAKLNSMENLSGKSDENHMRTDEDVHAERADSEHEEDASTSRTSSPDMDSTSDDDVQASTPTAASETTAQPNVPRSPPFKNPYMEFKVARSKELLQESAKQYQIMRQIWKLLHLFQNTKEFASSEQMIEAQRLLLIATQRQRAISRQLSCRSSEFKTLIPGQIEISSVHCLVKFPKHDEISDPEKYTTWFVCLLVRDENVIGTQAIAHAGPDPVVKFPGPFVFDNLDRYFEIHIVVYSLSVKNSTKKNSPESKSNLNEESRLKTTLTGFRAYAFEFCGWTKIQYANSRDVYRAVDARPKLDGLSPIAVSVVPILTSDPRRCAVVGVPLRCCRAWYAFQGRAVNFWVSPGNAGVCSRGGHTTGACRKGMSMILTTSNPDPGSWAGDLVQSDDAEEIEEFGREIEFVVFTVNKWRKDSRWTLTQSEFVVRTHSS